MHINKPLALARLFFVPIRRISVLLLLSLRKLLENQLYLRTDRQRRQRKNRSGFRGQVELGVVSLAVKINAKFSKNAPKRE